MDPFAAVALVGCQYMDLVSTSIQLRLLDTWLTGLIKVDEVSHLKLAYTGKAMLESSPECIDNSSLFFSQYNSAWQVLIKDVIVE